jgi:uncharacterized protein
MTLHDGGFAAVHGATDHERGWTFYYELLGQYNDGHDNCCITQDIQWEPAASGFVGVAGIPSPWTWNEEWYKFNSSQEWSAKPGFTILSRVTVATNTRPVSFVREYGNYRSFYTSLGHEGPSYTDPYFIQHVAGGIMWAARREALFQP